MASLGEPRKLHDISSLTGLNEHYDGSTVLITSGERHVIAYNLKEMKVQTTWSLTSKKRSSITCPAVVSASNEHYIAVVDKNVVRLWDSPDQELDKAPKFTTPHPVRQIIPLGIWSPVIIYEDGRMAWLHEPTEVFGESVQGELTWCGAQPSGNKYILVICTKLKDKEDMLVYSIRKDGDKDVKPLHVSLGKDVNTSATYCLHIEKSSVYLIQLCSDGNLYKTCVSGPSTGETIKLPSVRGIQSHSVVSSLGNTHLVFAGYTNSQLGKEGVCIWDMKFAVSQAWKPLPDEASNSLQIHVVHGQLLVYCGGALYGYRFHAPPTRLGEALGKLCQSSTSTPLQIQDNASENMKSVLETLLLPTINPGTQKFQRAFLKFKELAQKNHDTLLLLQPLVNKLILKCVSDKKHWAPKVLGQLINLGVVTAGESSEVMQALCDHGELMSILDSLHHIHDLPEKSLVQALAFCLRTNEQEFSTLTDEEMEDASTENIELTSDVSSPFGKPKAAFINQILLQPFNDVFLLEHLRKMDFSLCLDFLRHLHHLLVVTPPTYQDVNVSKQPNLQQVADWMIVLLDAHFAQLVLSTDARQLLIHLHQVLSVQVQFYDELFGLEGILSQLREKSAIPQKQTPGVYCIQTLHIY